MCGGIVTPRLRPYLPRIRAIMTEPRRLIISSVPMIVDFAVPAVMRMSETFPMIDIIHRVTRDVTPLAGEPITALRAGLPTGAPGLTWRSLGCLQIGLYGSADYVARKGFPDIDDGMRGLSLVWADANDLHAPWETWMARNGANARRLFCTEDETAHRFAIRSGRCAGFLPISSLLYVHGLVELCPPDPSWLAPLWLVSADDNLPPGPITEAVDYLADLLQRSLN